MESLALRSVGKSYGSYSALTDVNLAVEKGEFIVIVGPSGCGKSTLLKIICGLDDLTHGEIHIGGRDVTKADPGSRGIAMVFQSYALYPHMTVAENMGFGLRMAKKPKAEIDQAVRKAAQILRLTDQLDKLPKQLSGGQRQRVAIGRAITRSPEVFLFDEPLSNLDAALRTQMRVELAQLHKQLNSTIIYVTHDQVEAMTLADRIVVLNRGHVEQIGPPTELYERPRNRFVAGFLGSPRINFFEGQILEVGQGSALIGMEGAPPFKKRVGSSNLQVGPVTIGVRPEALHLDPSPTAASFGGTVTMMEALGRETIVYLDARPLVTTDSDTGTGNVALHLGAAAPYAPGTQLSVGFEPDRCHLFDRGNGRTIG
ncbi:ABC transporter ATP-binding protein [Rhizobium binae]|uniref:ABC transporter ATP-binding protein n=1 Tax=Rhizobium binae TaxID=1138190 RepID=UPI003DA87F17